ncbi:DUF2786 domain-containing protein [Amycolatopsis sp. H20-H5]|uniref:DUF2786 domain-containing protein n=1 Tax=Amycolatopsis sp. H20-H5 TaxID=3046309 RepID=UPI002DB90FAC|nr:DUF2786 domain-containing protein [Amycolatopsis sp. H20-H5]MEC3978789.1 DUF2786 domain-containing protein [Amycolatopsis sp. H20-H5]
MGKRNREKRAAKKRVRQSKGPTEPRNGFFAEPADFGTLPPLPPEVVANEMTHAAWGHGAGNTSAAADFATVFTTGRFVAEARAVATGAGIALVTVLERLWRSGWTPSDVWEHVRRNADDVATNLLVDGIAADTAKHAAATVHERWAAQVRGLGAEVWWKRDRPHLLQWAERAGADLERALLATVKMLAMLMTLPELPRILAPPGSASAGTAGQASGVDQKVLARVRGLLAKAESTQFPEEAEALSAKAQELMNRYAFERALLDADTHRKQTAGSIRLWLDAPYVEAKSHLVAAIAEANRCRSVFYSKLGFAALVGEETDLEITELLATSLLVQATRAMVAEGSHTTRTGTSRTRSFRQSFLVAYAVRIGERLGEAGVRAHDPVEDARLLPVLADRSRVVDETFQAMFSHTVERAASVSNGAGWHAGRAAADHADLLLERGVVDA